MLRPLLVLLPLLVTACAPMPPAETASAEEPGVVCEREIRTGSHMTSKHCRSAEQRDKERAEAQSFGDNVRATPPGGQPPGR